MELKIIVPATIYLMVAAVAFNNAPMLAPVSAKTMQGTTKGTAPICMARSASSGVSPMQSIVVSAPDVQSMMAKGFKVLPCSDAFPSFEDQLRWRDNICTITATSNSNVQDQLEQLIGERPAALCGMAELALGQWKR